jgi:hypothetical protein
MCTMVLEPDIMGRAIHKLTPEARSEVFSKDVEHRFYHMHVGQQADRRPSDESSLEEALPGCVENIV